MQVIAQLEDPTADLTPMYMYNKFIERVRRHLHLVLAFSPIGDAFRNRLRMFPSLINCCTIDWFKVRLHSTWTLSYDVSAFCGSDVIFGMFLALAGRRIGVGCTQVSG